MIKIPMIKDRNLHIILWSAIVILAATTVYFRFFWSPMDPYEEVFLSKISKFDLEHSLQEKADEVAPGSIKVPILIYHSVRPHTSNQSPLQKYYDVAPEQFIRQMQYLQDRGYVVIGLDYLATALEQNITLPAKSVVLTFDDGWRNQYAWAFPILRKYGYTATFFIFTNPIGQDYFLTWDQVRVMNNAGMTIGGHTESHPYLADILDPNMLREEIAGGKRIIEDQIGQKIDLFAYPYGYYMDKIIGVVKDAGYRVARGTHKGIEHSRDDLFKLSGVEVTDDFNKFVSDLNY